MGKSAIQMTQRFGDPQRNLWVSISHYDQVKLPNGVSRQRRVMMLGACEAFTISKPPALPGEYLTFGTSSICLTEVGLFAKIAGRCGG